MPEPVLTFESIWETRIVPLAGTIIRGFNGLVNEIVAVDQTSVVRVSRNGRPSRIPIEPFRWTVEKILGGATVERKAINEQFPYRHSSGVLLVLEQVNEFEVRGRPAAIRLRDGPARLSRTSGFTFRELESDVDPRRPLIYLWEIRDIAGRLVTCYVGKASRGAARPRRVYARNVRRLRAGLGWHGKSIDDYRDIHRHMSDAVDKGHSVTLTLVCNVEPGEDINAVERRERARLGCPGR